MLKFNKGDLPYNIFFHYPKWEKDLKKDLQEKSERFSERHMCSIKKKIGSSGGSGGLSFQSGICMQVFLFYYYSKTIYKQREHALYNIFPQDL